MGWDGITFMLDPVSRLQVDAMFPGKSRAPRVFVGTHEPHPSGVRDIGPHGDDPDGKLKIVMEILTGVTAEYFLPVTFNAVDFSSSHRIEKHHEQPGT